MLRDAARGDWEVELSPGLRHRWRRQRVRLVFDPQRATLPRGAWFTAPGSLGITLAVGFVMLFAPVPARFCRLKVTSVC